MLEISQNRYDYNLINNKPIKVDSSDEMVRAEKRGDDSKIEKSATKAKIIGHANI